MVEAMAQLLKEQKQGNIKLSCLLYFTRGKNVNKIFCPGSEAMGITPVCLRKQAGPSFT